MLGYFIRRVLVLIPVFLAVSAVIFSIIHLIPGDPIDNLLKIGAGPEQREIMTARYGLDKPLVVQYWIWLSGVLQGDLGTAIVARRPVADLIAQALPHSLALGLCALAFSTFFGIVLGTIAALTRDRWPDQLIMTVVLLGSTVPGFWLGLLLILVFSVWLGMFPVSGARDWSAMVLPVLTVGLGGTALVARVTRVAMVEAGQRDFLMLLHAKGMRPARIQLRHVLRHALIPVVTILSLRIGWILGGAVTVEVVFARPGLGTLLIKSLNQHDYPVVQACLLILAMAVMLGTLAGDLIQAAMDPRVRAAL
ncbi:ABC transporter permease [Pseudosulfitobacter pseudonitzschiae]|uniref:Glutathione ABC transporter permease n=1 Tax=Pseudosulfitobacter pseudonitzschiae TaxID=1402135 RepID=A0A073JIF6_9RHOB|nr:ABC transporter permease [Pseudosulfitobacter pseudonitzschiae]KEJ97487.1 glutathione ABC transporter permease [Pseudosulfitobacter pseudonitzschiae]MBM1814862.1 ABC transporter permease [Pseudosulfitobacter pseudonitzschiae]MBM1831856.1 ABC transporter permease [Pseudosulfitobacter pseudonitzschiae]MBM1836721.1 ABC transporter permease [Pseudosulfitobacter pseudonitzschiae]MBM1841568.1 ABC transporter permease [Pseudosulfitobacter pseudonitzschiae]